MGLGEFGNAALGAGLGMFGQALGNSMQLQQQQQLQDMQINGMQEMGRFNTDQSLKLWRKTGPEEYRKLLEKAGLNVGLMYGQGGAQGTTNFGGSNGASSSNASSESGMAQGMGMFAQAKLLDAQTRNIEADTELKEADARNKNADTTTTDNIRDLLVENMKQTGISQWFDNMKKEYMQSGKIENPEEIEMFRNQVYGKSVRSFNELSPEVQKFQAELFKTVAESKALDSTALLNNNKAQGYWRELLIAQQNADSNQVQAIAQKLSAEWNTGEFTNWKTWAELAKDAVQGVSQLMKGGGTMYKASAKGGK